jgi:hypothetical protein
MSLDRFPIFGRSLRVPIRPCALAHSKSFSSWDREGKPQKGTKDSEIAL